MHRCENCINCVVKVTLAKRKPTVKPKYAIPWANRRFVYGRIRCKQGMWRKNNGEEKTYKDSYVFNTAKDEQLSNAVSCPYFERI